MNIAIDLSPLQSPHRFRGIGYTIINFVSNISSEDRSKHKFIFYMLPHEHNNGDPLELLNLKEMDYEVRWLGPNARLSKQLPGRLRFIISTLNQLLSLKDQYFGDSRVKSLKDIDIFVQCDQSQSLPKKRRGLTRVLFLYDMIPYALEWDYLWSYKTARHVKGFSRKAALRCSARRWLYGHKLRAACRRADKLLAISEATKDDFVRLAGVNPKKISVTPLGITHNVKSGSAMNGNNLVRYYPTDWGYIPRNFSFDPTIPFILFVGGADKRRKLEELTAAFNMLRAQGVEIKLVLAGDSMQGPGNIATEEIQYALKTSSYIDDIIFMGFVDDATREWLYQHALAFVFPSRYEGFGLPVLEAMQYGTPVISYRNAATVEVAGDAAIYANDPIGLAESTRQLIDNPSIVSKYKKAGASQALRFSWDKTSKSIIDEAII